MSRYNVFAAILLSFFSPNLYRDVAQNWGMKALGYLLILLSLAFIPDILGAQIGITTVLKAYADDLTSQVPVLTVTHGVISTPENRPYLIYLHDVKDKPIAIIDTSGQYTNLDQTKAAILITPTQILTRPKPQEVRTTQISPTVDQVVDPKQVIPLIQKFAEWAWVVMFPVCVIVAFMYRVIQSVLYAILGKVLAAMMDVKLSFGQVMSVAMVAITPAIVLATVFDFFDIKYSFQLTSYFLITLLYLIFAIRANVTTGK